MLDKILRVPKEKILGVARIDDYLESDNYLRSLGPIDQPLLAFNPIISELEQDLIYWADNLILDQKCLILSYQDNCIAKIFPPYWSADTESYQVIDIVKPKFIWKKNPNIDKSIKFHNDPMENFTISPWDKDYELVWYLDPKNNPTEEKIWVYSCRPLGRKIRGQKDMNYISPIIDFDWQINSTLDKSMTFKNDPRQHHNFSLWDHDYELVWYLDPRVTDINKKVWALKSSAKGKKSRGVKDMGYVMPDINVEFNSNIPKFNLDINKLYPNYWELDYDNILYLDSMHHKKNQSIWAVKFSPNYKKSKGLKILGNISPDISIEYNKSLGKLNYDLDYNFLIYDFNYEHVWYLDRKHMEDGEEDIWAFKIRLSKNIKGSKNCGYISPNKTIEYNRDISELNYEINDTIKWYNLAYEHVWYLDRKHMEPGEEDIWAVKLKFAHRTRGSKNLGYISPQCQIEYNNVLPSLKYNINFDEIKWYNLAYEHVYYLDRKHMESGEDDIWTLKFNFTNKIKGTKNLGYHSPILNVEYNRSLPNFSYDLDYVIPWYDLGYKHIWYLSEEYAKSKEKIWTIKLNATENVEGEKEAGIIIPQISNQLDVIFISYNESNAETNWQRVLEKAPWAKRVHGIKGIFNAHKAAAKQSKTDMFYVVDGDAYLMDDWKFDYQPKIFDRDCAYVWSSQNPVNGLTYGYGGVKLFSKQILTKKKTWETLDMFTGIMPKIKVEEKVSCITMFNVDEFSTWRSAFRECVKLYISKQTDRLRVWKTKGKNKQFGKYAIEAAKFAEIFAKENEHNKENLLKINDYEWLKQQFNLLQIKDNNDKKV